MCTFILFLTLININLLYKTETETYEGVYMRYLRGGKMEKSQLGISSKLQ